MWHSGGSASLLHAQAGTGAEGARPSPKKRKARVKSAATFSSEQVAARWQSYQAKMQQPDMQHLAATRAALPIAGYRSAPCNLALSQTVIHNLAVCQLAMVDG